MSLSAVVLGAALLVVGTPSAGAQGPPEAGNPAVTIDKVVDQATVVAGDTIDYHLTITNTGDVTLTGLEVIDPNAPACAGPLADLAPTDDVVVDCSYTTIDPDDVGEYTNAAVVTSNEGALDLSETVSTTVEAPLNELTVTKSADQSAVVAGDDIDFHVTVENTGNLDLTGVTVTDANAPGCDSAVGALAAGAETTIDCTVTTDAGDVGTFSNVAAAVSDQTTSVDSNQVDVAVSAESFALDATKTVDQASVVAGEDIDYHITIENTGNRPLTGVSITDVDAPDCDGPVADLAAGAEVTVDCTYTTVGPADVGTYTNTASISSNELPPVDTNEVSTTVVAADPGVSISQAVDQTSVFVTQDIELHVTIENTGNTTLTGVTVNFFNAPECAGPIPDLAAGATTVVDCTHVAESDDAPTYKNTAAVDTDQTTFQASNQISVTVGIPACGADPVDVFLLEGDVPTEGADVILGTTGPDVIDSLGGADSICALGGNDVVTAGSGNDLIVGMNGDDELHGGSGNDVILGDGGLEENPGDDVITGDGGADYLEGNSGDDTIDGGVGNDNVLGFGGNDTLNGGDGVDRLDGVGGDDVVNGGDGNDHVLGGPGNDTLNGGGQSDTLVGSTGNDVMDGGGGSDIMNAGSGNDTLSGGGGTGADSLNAGTGDDTLNGGGGRDFLAGGDGIDTLNGESGDDQVEGGAGNDTARGDTGNDVVRGNDGNDLLRGNDGNDIVFGDAQNDNLFGDAGIDRLVGGSGNDRLSGGTGQDSCDGGTGSDVGDASCNARLQIP